MARRTIGLAVNQTIMMALSIIVVAALINAPGLGESIIVAIEKLKVGSAVEAGVAIVLLAMILDRLTASASQSNEGSGPGRPAARRIRAVSRRTLLWISLGIAVVGTVAGIVLNAGPAFPDQWHVTFAKPIDDATRWVEINLNPITDAIRNGVSYGFFNPLQTVLTTAPFWLVIALTAGIAWIVSGVRAAIVVAISLLLIVALQVWEHAMETLDDGPHGGRPDHGRGGHDGCLGGPESGRLGDPPAHQRRGPDAAVVRLPRSRRGALRRDPVHRDPGGRDLCRRRR